MKAYATWLLKRKELTYKICLIPHRQVCSEKILALRPNLRDSSQTHCCLVSYLSDQKTREVTGRCPTTAVQSFRAVFPTFLMIGWRVAGRGLLYFIPESDPQCSHWTSGDSLYRLHCSLKISVSFILLYYIIIVLLLYFLIAVIL